MEPSDISTLVAAVGASVTAIATIALWRVTNALARETKRMAEATGSPQIVATLRPNPWTMKYADLCIANTGNASAFDIRLSFTPPLRINEDYSSEEEKAPPFSKVSILKPGESLTSDIGRGFPLLDIDYQVTTSWLRHPTSEKRESLSFRLSLGDATGMARLGTPDPLIQIAQEVKNLREDWRLIAGGKRIAVDSYSSEDRADERHAREEHYRQIKSRDGQQS
ncbi:MULTISPECIES: hypothetical protein [unclassified Citromicrobium]|uniref:hypothetical protein n=1 Tax=unclassified Citromicrobium TaxID=2630544 RepID=UPI000AD58AFD|nr:MULTISPECIES: hypothetical protein [unclassified Citromicrobium]